MITALLARLLPRGVTLPLAAVFVVGIGYGIVLPVLPFMLARLIGGLTNEAVAWHTGLLTGVYMLGLFVFAPLWGRVSDRIGRRTMLLFGLAGFSGAMLVVGWLPNLTLVYAARALAGMFAAAVVPVVFAWVGDGQTPAERARAFSWLYAANALGFLFGPALSGWLASSTAAAPGADGTELPFYAVALLSGVLWLVAYRRFPADSVQHRNDVPPASAPSVLGLLTLSMLALFGLGSFEVGLALQGRQMSGLGPREIGWMFAECSLIMILMQVFVLAPLIERLGAGSMLAPGFLAMAAGVGLLPYAANYPVMLLAVALIAGAGGLLVPALAYLMSLSAGTQQGVAFGKQTAAASLGQAAGSAAAGGLFALSAGTPFWITAGVLALGAVMVARVPATLRAASAGRLR